MRETTNAKQTLVNPFKIKIHDANVTRFEHPDGCVIETSNGNHKMMKENWQKLYDTHKISELKYNNKYLLLLLMKLFSEKLRVIWKSLFIQLMTLRFKILIILS
jgi:hypothetical protein